VIEDVRSHLAAHDRRLAFLCGAGTSSAVNIEPPPPAGEKPKHRPLIPGIAGLTDVCETAVCAMGPPHDAAWKSLLKQCEQDGYPRNVENVLSRVRMKIDAVGEGETLVGLNRHQLSELEKTICGAIAKTVNPADDTIPKHTPHDDFAAWVRKVNRTAPIEIFTTNYDLLFERACEASRIPIFDGFVGTYYPFFYPECLDDDDLLPTAKWIRLWKVHGSVNWILKVGPTGKRVVRSQQAEGGELILPSHRKYDESRKQPYIAYMDRLSRILNAEHALLITCGYSFSDEHINAILYGALDSRKTANVIALQHGDLKEDSRSSQAAMRRTNLSVIGKNGGVISGRWGLWRLAQPVDNRTSSFMDIAFDSDAVPGDAEPSASAAVGLQGRMRLGDFNWLCRFLRAMDPST
jgi:hypothetical protein